MKIKQYEMLCGPGCLAAVLLGLLSGNVKAAELPVKGSAEQPVILLQLGKAPPVAAGQDPAIVVANGQPVSSEGAEYASAANDKVVVAHKGIGVWGAVFRFDLPAVHPSGPHTFWVRWMQGGDPAVCVQEFKVLAGASAESLEERGSFRMQYADSWKAAWINAGETMELKAGDVVVEIRNTGSGQDAKVFEAFLFSPGNPPPAPEGKRVGAAKVSGAGAPRGALVEFPIAGTPGKPAVALGFGKTPFNRPVQDPSFLIYPGQIVAKEGADAGIIGGDIAVVQHKGFGAWGATFQFDLTEPILPGYYTFHARYLSGGEVSQVLQTFTVKAGPDAEHAGVRGTFQTLNNTPGKHQWMTAKGTLTIFPGDKVIQIVNTGKAHDNKVFSGFVLGLENPLAAWFTAEGAQCRAAFLALAKKVENPEATLHVLDGKGPDGTLFAGLGEELLKPWYAKNSVAYLLGEESDKLAQELNVTSRPAAVLVNSDRKVIGVLSNPSDVAQVAGFLNKQGKGGIIPAYPDIKRPEPVALKNGTPEKWLVGTSWPGRCGVGDLGLDAEALQRPNPGDVFAYGLHSASLRSGRWEEREVSANGVCRITEKLADSLAWTKGTSYAVAYIDVVKPVKAVLHFQHSGIQSAVYLDGVDQPLQADKSPPLTLGRHAPKTRVDENNQPVVVQRPGPEIHDDITVPQSAEGPLAVTLDLAAGWHCLILKLVNSQGKDETVFIASQLTGTDGKPLDGIRAQTSDPTVPFSVAKAAAGLWPRLTFEGVPGNLPRPGDPLTLVADMRVAGYPPVWKLPLIAKWLPTMFLPIAATLRVRMTDYDGKELGVYETQGTFPDVVNLDLGKAPGAGFYSLIPELYAPDGKLIHRFHPDGFSVVLGNAAQKERVDKKELWLSHYYPFDNWEHNSAWLERTSLFHCMGSWPGVPRDAEAKWKDAQERGIVLWGDFAGDSPWSNNSESEAQKIVDVVPKYTRFFKSVNEIDGAATHPEWWATAKPEQWVKRAKWQYEALRKARPDAFFVSGSLYCSGVQRQAPPGAMSSRDWFRSCLQLGWDNYVDAWDVHAYPKNPPQLEAPSVANAGNESDLGVLSVYKELGKTNTKPFILGETSALAWHGFTGLRWQATTTAKMTAWTNSRKDWLGLALCGANHDRRVTAQSFSMARNPGEAAVYTASALIDGLPYRRVPTDDKEIQAAYFGDTFMIWRADDKEGRYSMPLDGATQWVLVDVVGRVKPLEVKEERANFPIGTSPVYVLATAEYEKLTR